MAVTGGVGGGQERDTRFGPISGPCWLLYAAFALSLLVRVGRVGWEGGVVLEGGPMVWYEPCSVYLKVGCC